jgi:hypothetical protein
MPTPTNERSEVLTNEVRNIPERDEELEKFIGQAFEDVLFQGRQPPSAYEVCRMVSAFSARRARYKAIEDFKAILDYVEDIGENHIQHARKTVPDALTLIRKILKSQPQ